MNLRFRFIFMLSLLLFSAAANAQQPAPETRSRESVTRDLEELARVASVMIDGDLAGRIMTERALGFMLKRDPKDPWAASDNFDVNHDPYILTKKTLIRLSRLVAFACDVNLWQPIPKVPGKIQILIRNSNEWSLFWTWGVLVQDTHAEMQKVLAAGARVTVAGKNGVISVLTPVYNGLGEVVAVAEVTGMDPAVQPPPVHAMLAPPSNYAPQASRPLTPCGADFSVPSP